MGQAERMGNPLHEMVIALSEADTWYEAAAEWSVVNRVDMDQPTYTCLCNQQGLRYIHTIRNMENGAQIEPVGSECIHKFGDAADLQTELDVFALLSRTRSELLRGGEIHMDTEFFSRKALAYMYEDGAFPPSRYNGGDPHSDYEYMLMIFNKRDPSLLSDPQFRKYDALMDQAVVPYLLRSTKFGGLEFDSRFSDMDEDEFEDFSVQALDKGCEQTRFVIKDDMRFFNNAAHAGEVVTHLFRLDDGGPTPQTAGNRIVQGLGNGRFATVSGVTEGEAALDRYRYTHGQVVGQQGRLRVELIDYVFIDRATDRPRRAANGMAVDSDEVLGAFHDVAQRAGVDLSGDVMALHVDHPDGVHIHRIFDPGSTVSLRDGFKRLN